MGTERRQPADLLRLNALIDGELSPADRAEMAARMAADRDLARTHATLARLKACIAEPGKAEAEASSAELPKRSIRRLRPVAIGTAVAAAVIVAIVALTGTDRPDVPPPAQHALIVLAALPGNTVVPELGLAGLKLTDVAIDYSGPVRSLRATYLGRQGCRLDLRIRPAEAAVKPLDGTSLRSWTVGGIAYDLSAHGMPTWRFSLIAEAAERQTRNGQLPDNVAAQIKEARVSAPPCVG